MNSGVNENKFKINQYIMTKDVKNRSSDYLDNRSTSENFFTLCAQIKDYFTKDFEKKGQSLDGWLERQKRAIIGYEKETQFFIAKIQGYLAQQDLNHTNFPKWYRNLSEGIFHEVWGICGIAEWLYGNNKVLKESTSAKIIGDRIYFMVNGKLMLQQQTISSERRQQLKKALLLHTPEKRLEEDYLEIYMLDGTRITIYGEKITKKNQDVIVFRKYILPKLTFEAQVDRGTIPKEAVPLFKDMIKMGFNVAFLGAVRTAKTTFLQTWQSYEDQSLEGVLIETDPEIALHRLMPQAPIIQLVADNEKLENIVKSILRSDADYIVMGEARDGVALNIAVKIANKGTRRVKITYHTSDPIDFCYDVSDEITKKYGGNTFNTMIKVAKSFHYLFHFIQLKDKNQKRLKGIFEVRYDSTSNEIMIYQICKYDIKNDSWNFSYSFGDDKEMIGEEEDVVAKESFKQNLKYLSKQFYMDDKVYRPAYFSKRGETFE